VVGETNCQQVVHTWRIASEDSNSSRFSCNHHYRVGDATNLVLLSPIGVYPETTGARHRIISMSRCIARMGHEVTVISLTSALPALRSKRASIKVNPNLTILTSHLWDPMVLRELLLADIVQFEYPYLLPFMLLLRVIGKPFVLDEHGVESDALKRSRCCRSSLPFWRDRNRTVPKARKSGRQESQSPLPKVHHDSASRASECTNGNEYGDSCEQGQGGHPE